MIDLKKREGKEVRLEATMFEISIRGKERNEKSINKPKNPQWNKWNKWNKMEQYLDIPITYLLLVRRKKKEI